VLILLSGRFFAALMKSQIVWNEVSSSKMKTRDVLRLIPEDGWYQTAQRGSHRQFKHPVKPGKVTIAGHPSDEMAEGTCKSILKQAGLQK
jgi:predicted RNA binding protein YcfA (HicA-like mRNA interferase family)